MLAPFLNGPSKAQPGGKAPLGLGITLELRCYGNRFSVGFFFFSSSTENLSHRLLGAHGGGVAVLQLPRRLCGDSVGPPTHNPLPGLSCLPDSFALF